MIPLLILLQADTPVNNTVEVIKAIGSVLSILITAASPFLVAWFNKKMNKVTESQRIIAVDTKDTNEKITAVASKVDGLLDKKALADEALGKIKGLEEAAKEEGIANKREVEIRREQDLINQTPPQNQRNRDSEIKDAQDKIVETLETQIHKKGEEMKKVVENKSDQIKDEVEKVPDEVVKKLPPK